MLLSNFHLITNKASLQFELFQEVLKILLLSPRVSDVLELWFESVHSDNISVLKFALQKYDEKFRGSDNIKTISGCSFICGVMPVYLFNLK